MLVSKAWQAVTTTAMMVAVTVVTSFCLLLVVNSAAAAASQAARLSVARAQLSGASAGNFALFAGGYTVNGSDSDVVDIYDARTRSWSTARLSEGRGVMAATACSADGSSNGNIKAFFAGGKHSHANRTSAVDVFDATTHSWSRLNLSVPRSMVSAVCAHGRVYFAGGELGENRANASTSEDSDVVDVLDVASLKWLPPLRLSRPRKKLASAAVGKYVIFAGGYLSGVGSLDTVDVLDTSTGTVSRASKPLSTPRFRLQAASVGDLALFISGQGCDWTCKLADVFDARTGTWSVVNMTSGRYEFGAVTLDERYIVVGGGKMPRQGNATVLDVFDITTMRWRNNSATRLSAPRFYLGSAAAAISQPAAGGGPHADVALFAGGVGPNGVSDAVDIFSAADLSPSTAAVVVVADAEAPLPVSPPPPPPPPPSPSLYTRVLLTDAVASGAVCLDGSPGAFYIRKPISTAAATTSTTGTDNNKWTLFMEGGGWCAGDENCLWRAGTDLGSSKAYPPTPVGMESTSLFDMLPDQTVVYAKYCDGGSWTGNVSAPVRVGNATIYYRGRRLLDALLDDLLARGLATADEFLFSGCSAGALTTYVHADYVAARVRARSPNVRVAALGDAMFSLQHKDYNNDPVNYYTNQFTWGYTAWNSGASINQACRAHYSSAAGGDDKAAWVCFHGAIAARFISTPTLVVNSKYDTWQERGVLGLNTTLCPGTVAPSNGAITLCHNDTAAARAQGAFWLTYGDQMMAAMGKLPKRHGAFLTNCPTHCQSSALGNPSTPGEFLGAAIATWLPQVMAHGGEPDYIAPRWIATNGDACVRQPATTS